MYDVSRVRPAPADNLSHNGYATVLRFTNAARPAPVERAPAEKPGAVRNGRFELGLLGAFRLVVDGAPAVVGWSGQRLLVSLASFGRQASRDRIAQTLWPDTRADRAQANLRSTLYRLRKVCPGLVHSAKTHLRLASELLIDAEYTRTVALSLVNAPPGRDCAVWPIMPLAELALDLLPDWDEEWLRDDQFSYRRLRLDALDRLADLLVRQQRHGAAVQAALAVIQVDPLRESAHEALLRAYIAQGNRYEAVSHYTSYRRTLLDELGLEPAAELGDLLWRRAG